MRSGGRGAQLIKRPNTPFIKSASVMFHGKHRNKGYDSADFFCETFSSIASDEVKKVIKGYGDIVSRET